MKIPLDKICVRTGVLCPSCQAKIDRGLYEPWEVEVMKAILEAEEELGELGFEYVKARRMGRTLLIIVRNARRIPRGLEERLARELERLGVGRVQIVEEWRGPEDLVRKALHPARVVFMNRYYSPDGTIYIIAHVPEADRDKLAGRIEVAQNLLRENFGGYDLMVRLVKSQEPGRVEIEKPDPAKLRGIFDELGP